MSKKAAKPKRPRPARTTSMKNAPPRKAKAPPRPREVKPDAAQLPLNEPAHAPRLVEIKGVIEGCSGPVWSRLLALSENRDASVSREVEQVKTRKAMEEMIAEQQINAALKDAGAKAKERLRDLKSEHFDVEQSIDLERARIRWFADQIGNVIKHARQGKLYHEDEPTEPTQEMLFPPPKKEEKGEKRKGKAKPEQTEPAQVPEGEDQQLAASVKELELSPLVEGRLLEHGFNTIADVAKAVDAEVDLGAKLDLGDNHVAGIVMQLKAYRKDHRQAIREREAELVEA